jgi:hypothetical protein
MTKNTTTVELTEKDIEFLADACSIARDHYCNKARFSCDKCKYQIRCEILSELELSLKGK